MGSGLQNVVVGYLGPASPHRDALRTLVAGAGGTLVEMPDSAAAGGYRRGWAARGRRAADQLLGTRDHAFMEKTLATIDETGVDVLLAYWGTNPLPDLRAIKRKRPDLPCLLSVLCHPTGLTGRRIAVQNWLMRRSAPFLAGVIYPSAVMARYFRERVFGPDGPPGIVVRPCWPSAWHAAGERPSPGPEPAVIFLGRMGGGQPCDDVRKALHSLARSRVAVHHVAGRNDNETGPACQTFPPGEVADVIRFARRFDASLVLYNTAGHRGDRFSNTVPDRLISSVAAGVPVAIPRRGYEACKEYLADFPAVIEFDSMEELASLLRNRERIHELRTGAAAAQAGYTAEGESAELFETLKNVMRPKGPGLRGPIRGPAAVEIR